MSRVILIVLACAACGDDSANLDAPTQQDAPTIDAPGADAPIDAAPDARPVTCNSTDAGTSVTVGPIIELPLLPPRDPALPFNHSFEPSVAASGGNVVVAGINIHLLSANDFGFDTNDAGADLIDKRVATWTSHNRGATFGPATDPIVVAESSTTDPVIRVAADGTFILSRLGQIPNGCVLVRSVDHGDTWISIADGIPCSDKPWIAIDDVSHSVFGLGFGRYFRYTFDGTALGSAGSSLQGITGYVDGRGAHFVGTTGSPVAQAWFWDGVSPPSQEGGDVPGGSRAQLETYTGMSMGGTGDGGQWIVHALKDAASARVVLRVRYLPGDDGIDVPISPPGDFAFFPAAAMDAAGRLHVTWYDTSGSSGKLKYAHTLTCALVDGFTTPVVIDAAAVPGDNFYPFFSTPQGGRRLREYIDIAIDGSRAHLVWTHAPNAPARVQTTYVDFD